MTAVDVVALALFLGVLPAMSLYQARLLPGLEVERIPVYGSTAVTLVVLGAVAWLLASRHDGGAALGLTAIPPGAFLLWTGSVVGLGLALTLAFRRLGMALGLREAPVMRDLIPRTRRERVAFAGVSLAAGVGEELAYRGYVIPLLVPLLGAWGAVGASSLVFGLLHAYQGPLGMARTAAMGGVLAWAFLESGSLWPPMAAHAVFNIIVGTMLAERLMVPEEIEEPHGR